MAATVIPPQSSASRNMPPGIRRVPPTTTFPPPPIPEQFSMSASNSSGSMLSATTPLSAAQVIALATEAMSSALQENENQAAEASGVSTELKPGVTIDLSRKNIQALPDEVVDIIKNELERLALSHNKLSSLPSRFSECTHLRYLNVRNNQIREFPLSLCDLKSLEILDMGRNKIRVLPPEIAKLTSLKVLAVQKNRIEELPLCLADMVSLQMLRLDGNNILFPPKEILQVQGGSPPNEGFLKESEMTEVTVTAHIKRYLRQKSQSMLGREKEGENGGDELSEGTETPRVPIRRVVSGRFPIRVNGSDVSDPRSPAILRAPPIPSRSHARGLSQQNGVIRRPGVMPLTIGTPNERVRSNSETLSQTTSTVRPSERHRRMGIVPRKGTELGTLDEGQANNRFSHYRGLSHGSSMTGSIDPNASSAVSPNSPAEPLLHRPNYVRRLSILPEQRRESRIFDPVIESAKGILYAIFQIHPMIQLFTRLTNDGTSKRSSLEIVFYNTNDHVEQLEQEIQKHEFVADNGPYTPRENENVQRAVLTLINAYSHICSLLMDNMDTIVDNGDPRYIRTMVMLLYHSIMELRVTANEISGDGVGHAPSQRYHRPALDDTIKPHSRESSMTPTIERPGLAGRPRPGAFVHNPSSLRVSTDVSVPYINGTGRTAQVTSATPRSGESFTSSTADIRYAADFTADERAFERIFLSLQKSSDLVMRILPNINQQFMLGKRNAEHQRSPDQTIRCWKSLIAKCSIAINDTERLKDRLSLIKLKEPGVRTDPLFWILCKSFIDSWAEFGSRLKASMDQIPFPLDTRTKLRPIQISIKETNQLIMTSPWQYLLRHAGNHINDVSGHYPSGHYSSNHYQSNSSVSQMQLPMTPQSAALGPAVQATVPSTPQSASFANAFNGNVFERADALISMGGLSMSRHGTMNSTSTSLSSSFSSLTSVQDDRQAMLSPNGNAGSTSFRHNKPSF
ncbi:putative cell morphogenesis protein Sog2 [Durotheca rogersii]|uniref:putative cell morphogenesis protein Sog2 n=1 Tax=Durotheca rogersii TaxID=419775 RepID=UPI0022207DF8|nr:putative cell morphogenesis protein Sog2 [Durotheca rogersii]KAI5862413.1 putative cell morphogenesis protein Sog2 [Durotheca rogersii]